MKRDLLKGMNLTEDQIDKIMKVNGTDIEAAKATAGDVEAIKQENDSLKAQLADRRKDITVLKKQAKGNDDLQSQLQSLQDKYTKETEKLTDQLAQTKLNGALTNALTSAKARNPKTVEALLDMDKLNLDDDGKLTGLDDQLDAIKKDNAFLFDKGTQSDYEPGGGNGSSDQDQVQAMVDAFK